MYTVFIVALAIGVIALSVDFVLLARQVNDLEDRLDSLKKDR